MLKTSIKKIKMNYKIIFFLLFCVQISFSQQNNTEDFPEFKSCENKQDLSKKDCFYRNLQQHILANFKIPESANAYNGKVYALLSITRYSVTFPESWYSAKALIQRE